MPPVVTFGPDSPQFRDGWGAFVDYERALSDIGVPPIQIYEMARSVTGRSARRGFRAHAAAYYASYRAAMRRRHLP
ncbi:hypothetical protein C5748_07320 [Phyllobacterium phragmitis]|uniref:Uncharacterized protein n=1 Tax=Phyllobacterium phragmitis TaxID=2670329 RepID=A0A2S9IV46_9HYPH|nr:hypothetical protein [Phyllobacterium phragmitis]PRD44381.1 hypothetical protein C5748_07320 [Phyllobacterium phragmitis]